MKTTRTHGTTCPAEASPSAPFGTAADSALLLDSLQHVIDRGLVERHAFGTMTTHFHLLVRSLTGQLSTALRIVQNADFRRVQP